MTRLSDLPINRLVELELRYDGPIPQDAIDHAYANGCAEGDKAGKASIMARSWADQQRLSLRRAHEYRQRPGYENHLEQALESAKAAGMYKRECKALVNSLTNKAA